MADSATLGRRIRFRSQRNQPWALILGEFVAVLAISVGLTGLIRGGGWWIAVVLIGALMLLTGAVARGIRSPLALVPIVQLAVLLLTITAVFAGRNSLLGFIPDGSTFGALGSLVGRAMEDIRLDSVPAQADTALLLLVVGGTGIVTIVLDTLATTFRRPALAGLAIVATLLVPAFITGTSVWAIVICALAYFYLIRCAERVRRAEAARPGASFVIAAGAVVIALIAYAVVPGLTNSVGRTVSPHALGHATVSPLVELGQDLREPKPFDVLRYTTNSAQPPYLKLTSLNDFTGNAWSRSSQVTRPVPQDDAIGPALGLSHRVRVGHVTTVVTVQSLASSFLPAPSIVTGVHGLSGSWTWSPADLSLESSGSSAKGQKYTVDSTEIDPTVRQLDQAGGSVPASVRPELQLPADMPSVIVQTAKKATAGDTSEYQEALDLQDFFRENDFVYSTKTPLRQGYDGAGLNVIAKFLTVKSGYCVHFASAMAIMARVLGIPAEVDVGYVPGNIVRQLPHGRSEYSVTSADLHAWPVLYLGGLGWVSFEPTVGTPTVPSYSAPSASQVTQSSSSSATAHGAKIAPQKRRLSAQNSGSAAVQRTSPVISATAVITIGSLFAVFIVLVLVIPAAARTGLRRRRLRSKRPHRGRPGQAPSASDCWEEVRETALDLRWPAPETETPRNFGDRLRAEFAADERIARLAGARNASSDESAAVARLLDAAERERFGSRTAATVVDRGGDGHGDGDDDAVAGARMAHDATVVIGALADRTRPWRRFLARLLPPTTWEHALVALRHRRRTDSGDSGSSNDSFGSSA